MPITTKPEVRPYEHTFLTPEVIDHLVRTDPYGLLQEAEWHRSPKALRKVDRAMAEAVKALAAEVIGSTPEPEVVEVEGPKPTKYGRMADGTPISTFASTLAHAQRKTIGGKYADINPQALAFAKVLALLGY